MNLTATAKLIDSADRLMFFCQCRTPAVASRAAERVARLARRSANPRAGHRLSAALVELRHGMLQERAAWRGAEGAAQTATRHYLEMARQFEAFRRALVQPSV